MYRNQNQRRKSARVQPYEITSSSCSSSSTAAANRKSAQFVLPVLDPELTRSLLKNRQTLPNQSTTITETLAENNKSTNSMRPLIEKNDNQMSKSDQSINKQTNNLTENQVDNNKNTESLNTAISDLPMDKSNKMKVPTGDSHRSSQRSNKTNSQNNEQTNIMQSNRQSNSQPKQLNSNQTINDDDLFDSEFSEFDKFLCNASLEERLNDLVEEKQPEEESDVESEPRVIDGDDELFDSDAINNETDCDSQMCGSEIDENQLNEFKISDSNGKSSIYKNDPFEGCENEFEEDDSFEMELDSTLIFRSDDPILSQYITQIVDNVPEEENGFKTASGVPVKIKMTEEEQRKKAESLGIFFRPK